MRITKDELERCEGPGVTVTSRLCPRRQEEERRIEVPVPTPPRPRTKLVLELPELPPPLPPPVPLRIKQDLPELPKMKIKFSTCTALYVPPKPIYENYKKISGDTTAHHSRSTTLKLEYDKLKKRNRRRSSMN